VLIIEPKVFVDSRGFFLEEYQHRRYAEAGISNDFLQDNLSRSMRGVLRGLHFQIEIPQAKLVTVINGAVFDAVVDLRAGSPTFGRWFGIELSDIGPRQIFVPAGFAHGFCALSEFADVHYRTDQYYNPSDEGGLLWNDADVGVAWPIVPTDITARDAGFPLLRDIASENLPRVTKG
jgi:dTDP-4-dehydrorhamnose 3,5-epimerase